jgi:hypothetical protein
MMEPLKQKRHVWRYVRPGGSRVAFNVDTLVDFLLTSGDFIDPITRIAFTDDDLADIDRTAKASGVKKPSVLEARKNPQAYADAKFRRDALEGLERCAGEVVANMLSLVERVDPDEAQMRLMLIELPQFADYYSQLREADTPYAQQAMQHWMQFIVGPPNKPHPDPFGLIDLISQCFKSLRNSATGVLDHHIFMADDSGDY